MLSKVTIQLLEEVMGHFDEIDRTVYGHVTDKRKKKVQEDPEACLVSLLTLIKEGLPKSYATLSQSIEGAAYDDYVKKAQEKLRQSQ